MFFGDFEWKFSPCLYVLAYLAFDFVNLKRNIWEFKAIIFWANMDVMRFKKWVATNDRVCGVEQ